jgi:hypothetical protein
MIPPSPRILTKALTCLALVAVHAFSGSSRAAELTPEQIQSLKARLQALKDNLSNHLTSRNTGAAQAFQSGASDPKAAVELYLNCVKLVNFDREGRPESDFKTWKDNQTNLKDAKFIESLQGQLRYLALSCQAVETEDKTRVMGALVNHVDGLARLSEVPSGPVAQSVANSVFAKAYYLERLLGSNEGWEPVPVNISGIYSRTILPHLRENDPGALMNAWDKRIEQQTRLVMMLEEARLAELRGLSRDEKSRARGQQTNQGGALREHSKEEFMNRTLPRLKWGKLKDMFLYVDQVNGAKAMLDFVEANLTHEFGEDYYKEFESLITSAQGVGSARSPGTLEPGEDSAPQ